VEGLSRQRELEFKEKKVLKSTYPQNPDDPRIFKIQLLIRLPCFYLCGSHSTYIDYSILVCISKI
jgi:hypothetical protein